MVFDIQHLASVALDAQPVVGARQHRIAELIEHRRLGVRLVGRQPVVARISDDTAVAIDDERPSG